MKKSNQNIFKDLLISTKPTRDDLRRLVNKSKDFLKLDESDGKVIIETQFAFTVTDKIVLFLIGIFFAKEAGLKDKSDDTGKNISEEINVAHSTISGPLGRLIQTKVVNYDQERGTYSIKYNKMEEELEKLNKKCASESSTKTKVIKKIRPAKKKNKKRSDPVIEKTKSFESNLKKYNLERDQFDSLFIIDNGTILLKEVFPPNASLKEKHVKGTLFLLIAYSIYFAKEEVESSLLRDSLEHSGLTNLVSLSSSLKKVSALVIHKRGKKGSTKTSYRATTQGRAAGVTIIKDILEGTKNFEVDFKKQIKLKKAPAIAIDTGVLDQEIKKLSERRDLDLAKLKSNFDFQSDHLSLLQDVPGKNRKEKQLKALLLLSYILSEVYSLEGFNGRELLNESYIDSNRLDLLNSSKYYKYYFISNRSKLNMGLTYRGKEKALSMLREFLSKGDCVLE